MLDVFCSKEIPNLKKIALDSNILQKHKLASDCISPMCTLHVSLCVWLRIVSFAHLHRSTISVDDLKNVFGRLEKSSYGKYAKPHQAQAKFIRIRNRKHFRFFPTSGFIRSQAPLHPMILGVPILGAPKTRDC